MKSLDEKQKPRVLILAGTSQAYEIALLSHKFPDLHFNASMAGLSRLRTDWPIHCRRGGFGGDDGFADYIKQQKLSALIIALHPFAETMTKRAIRLAHKIRLPVLWLKRPPWQPVEGDRWLSVHLPSQVAPLCAADDRLFYAAGQKSLAEAWPITSQKIFVRTFSKPDFHRHSDTLGNATNIQWLISQGDMTEQSEIQTFRKLKITRLVVKNAGGAKSYGKIAAARALSLPVIVIERTSRMLFDKVNTVSSVSQVERWLEQLLRQLKIP